MDKFATLPPAVQEALLDGPALKPPDGVTPDFDNPPNRTQMGLAVIIVCLLLPTIAGSMRLYTRLFIVKKWHIEDFLGIVAYGAFMGTIWTCLCFLRYAGMFVNQWNIRAGTMIQIAYVSYILTIMYCLFMGCAKVAILLEWTRIFVPAGVRDYFWWISRVLIVVNIGLYLSAMVATVLYCVPVEKVWHTWVPGHCLNRKALDACVAAFNLATDVFILALPQRIIWSLSANFARRVAISFMFSIGLLACTAAVFRTYLVSQLDYHGDMTFNLSKNFLLVISEMVCVLLVFFIPPSSRTITQSNILQKILASLRSWTGRTSANGEKPPKRCSGRNNNPPTIGSPPAKGACRMVDEDGQPLSLTELKFMRGGDIESGGSSVGTNSSAGPCRYSHKTRGNGIIRTTEVEQFEGGVSKAKVERDIRKCQHPWMNDRAHGSGD